MLTVQACQEDRLVVAMQPNKAKSFPAATVQVVKPPPWKTWDLKRGEYECSGAYANKQECRRWRSRGVLGVLHQARRENEGNYLGRKHLELTERRRAFARRKRRGKRAERKAARTKHKATRARSQLDELTFGTSNVRTAATNGVNGIGNMTPC